MLENKSLDNYSKIYIKNLPLCSSITEIKNKLKNYLQKYGNIRSMKISSDKIDNQYKFFAIINFDAHETAKKVLEECNNQDIFDVG